MSITVILLAGGTGTRMGTSTPKQFLQLNGKTVAQHSFNTFLNIPSVTEVIVVCHPNFHHHFQTPSKTPILFALPGARRQDSMKNGLLTSKTKTEMICIHDAARPFVTEKITLMTLEAAKKHGAAIVGAPVKCTIKQCNENLIVTNTPDRSTLYEIQTPQIIERSLLEQGLSHVEKNDLTVTDDASIVENIGCHVKIVEGGYENIKITTPDDLQLAKYFCCT